MKKDLFDTIAPIYGLFYSYQKKAFQKALAELETQVDLQSCKKIIDIGSGTGALCSVLNQRGFEITGVDPAAKMLAVGKGKLENRGINFVQANVLDQLPFEDQSFDVSFSSFVAHGLKADQRKVMYSEMSRITRSLVIFYDYNEKRSLLTDVAEWLEGGDYFQFIKSVQSELLDNFQDCRVIPSGSYTAWYVCKARV